MRWILTVDVRPTDLLTCVCYHVSMDLSLCGMFLTSLSVKAATNEVEGNNRIQHRVKNVYLIMNWVLF